MIEDYPEWVPPVVQDTFRSLHMDNEHLRRFIDDERMASVWSYLGRQDPQIAGIHTSDRNGLLSSLSGPIDRALYDTHEQALAVLCINVWMFTSRTRDGKIFVPKKAEQDAHAELFDNLVRDCERLKTFFGLPLRSDVESAANVLIDFCEGWSETIKQRDNPYLLIRKRTDDEAMILFRSFIQGISKVTKALWGASFYKNICIIGEVLFDLKHDPDRVEAVKKMCSARPSQ